MASARHHGDAREKPPSVAPATKRTAGRPQLIARSAGSADTYRYRTKDYIKLATIRPIHASIGTLTPSR